MANWNPKRDPQPDRKDNAMFKTFLKLKYDDRRFQEPSKRDVSQDSSDEVKEKKKKKSRKTKMESSGEDSDEVVP